MGTAIKNKDVYAEVEQAFGMVPDWVRQMPEGSANGFWRLMQDFHFAETKIPNKYKELIGIAVAGATRCRYCALFHTEAARFFGASDEEIAEASMVAGFTMAGSTFLNAQQVDYERFRRETLEMLDFARQQIAQHSAAAPSSSKGAKRVAHA